MADFSRRVVLVAAIVLLAAGTVFGESGGQRRVALVIGNSSYSAVEKLVNPANDARLIARTLQDAGFTLVGGGPQLDLDKHGFDVAIQAFGQIVQGADTALFYYSGHGMQVQGTNWLVPVDANPASTRDLDFQAIDADLVLRQMDGSGTRLNLIILDACRNNPFSVRGVRATGGGLAEMRAPGGTLISYATQPGNVAYDGATSDSPFTTALAAAMRRPGLDVFQVFNQVGLAVTQQTDGAQQPWLASSPIAGNFYFFGPVTLAPGSTAENTDDLVFWQSVSNSREPTELRAYLHRFPNGEFAELAQARLAALIGNNPQVQTDAASPTTPLLPSGTSAPTVMSDPQTPSPSVPPSAGHVCLPPTAIHGMTRPGGTSTTMVLAGEDSCGGRLWTPKDGAPYQQVLVVQPPKAGRVEIYANNGFRYIRPNGYTGGDAFTIVATGRDSHGESWVGRLHVNVVIAGS